MRNIFKKNNAEAKNKKRKVRRKQLLYYSCPSLQEKKRKYDEDHSEEKRLFRPLIRDDILDADEMKCILNDVGDYQKRIKQLEAENNRATASQSRIQKELEKLK